MTKVKLEVKYDAKVCSKCGIPQLGQDFCMWLQVVYPSYDEIQWCVRLKETNVGNGESFIEYHRYILHVYKLHVSLIDIHVSMYPF